MDKINQVKVLESIAEGIICDASILVKYLWENNEETRNLLQYVLIKFDWIDAAIANGAYLFRRNGTWREGYRNFADNAKTYPSKEEVAIDFCKKNNIKPKMVTAKSHHIIKKWLAQEMQIRGEMVIIDFLGFNIWGKKEDGPPSKSKVIEDIANHD